MDTHRVHRMNMCRLWRGAHSPHGDEQTKSQTHAALGVTWESRYVHGLEISALDDCQRESPSSRQVAEREHEFPQVHAFLSDRKHTPRHSRCGLVMATTSQGGHEAPQSKVEASGEGLNLCVCVMMNHHHGLTARKCINNYRWQTSSTKSKGQILE